ncbi:MAG: hypothetical protein LUQ22_05570 [Methanotrichaceae archaeon]|nr:hypothetical protein [Methanotrichaceae archaeon]
MILHRIKHFESSVKKEKVVDHRIETNGIVGDKRMNWNKLIRLLFLLSLATAAIQAIHAKDIPSELKSESVEIQNILQNESAYDGKLVVIEGKIVDECGSGCWFIIDDGTANIYVDILPNNFVIPQKRGSNAKVYGEVTTKNGDTMIVGKMVETGGEIYS